jgi:S-adenosylmethionine synthetase
MVDTYGTGKVSESNLVRLIKKHFQLTPKGMIEILDLRRPIYLKTAAYGHFGRTEPEFTWERLDKVEDLKRDA